VRIYLVGPRYDAAGNLDYRWLRPVKEVDWIDAWCFDGRPKQSTWNVDDAVVEEDALERPRGDFPYLTGQVLVIAARAVAAVGSLAAESGELLPLRGRDGAEYALFNAVPRYECVDETQSQWKTGPSGRRLWIQRYAFVKERLPPVSLFKAQASTSHLLATEGLLDDRHEFKSQVEQGGLRGLEFREVWNDEGREIPLIPR
jgi:hypothetical protein